MIYEYKHWYRIFRLGMLSVWYWTIKISCLKLHKVGITQCNSEVTLLECHLSSNLHDTSSLSTLWQYFKYQSVDCNIFCCALGKYDISFFLINHLVTGLYKLYWIFYPMVKVYTGIKTVLLGDGSYCYSHIFACCWLNLVVLHDSLNMSVWFIFQLIWKQAMPAPSKLDRTVDQSRYLSVKVVSHNYSGSLFNPGGIYIQITFNNIA